MIAPYDQYYLHAELSGLRPGRKYYYAVGYEGFDPRHADAAFTIAPARHLPPGKFTFTAFGDQDAMRGNRVAQEVPIGGTANEGTVYATCGGGGKSLYNFPAPDTYKGNEKLHVDVPSYHWAPGKAKVAETVQWSRVRYTGYAFMAIDSEPGANPS